MTDQPMLPYDQTGGHSGSTTSRERAQREVRDGTKQARLASLLRLLAARGPRGLTVAEYRDAADIHHGKASADLSNLHKIGRIARLAERRGRCEVYILPEYVGNRRTREPRSNADRCQHPASVCAATDAMLADTTIRLSDANRRLAEIHRLLGSHAYDGTPNLRLDAIRHAIGDHR